MTLVDTNKYLTGDDHPFLDVTCPIGSIDHLLLSCHVGLDLVREAIGGIENITAHEFVTPFDLCDVPCRGVERLIFEAFWQASGARP